MSRVWVYSDGSITGNGKPGSIGGWGAVLLWEYAPGHYYVREIGGAAFETTNNRMEMLAPIQALRCVKKPVPITVVSDSQYVVNGASQWMVRWVKSGAIRKMLNGDLWMDIQELKAEHDITWQWVRGHIGDLWNERVDEIAGTMVKRAKVEGESVTHEARYRRAWTPPG